MDVIEFRVDRSGGRPKPNYGISILVNSRPLGELAREIERPFADAEGHPELAGGYLGLSWGDISESPEHFLGSPSAVCFEDGDTVLMGCVCGQWECWPLTADIAIDDTSVQWSHFRNGHRDWDLTGLGPFTFDLGQYKSALAILADI